MFLKINKHLTLLLLIFLLTGCFRFVNLDSGKGYTSRTSSKVVTHHRVNKGETLYSIAFEYGRDHRDVARWNGIRKPYTIYPKQKLRVIPISADRRNVTKRPKKTVEKRQVRATKPRPIKAKEHYPSVLKWKWPTRGKVVSTFSIRDPGRRGIDIVGRKGQPVKAAAAGRIVYQGNGLRGYGNLVIIKHNETYFSAYAHTENVVVKENEKVKLGQLIADMSNTNTDKTKLHFEIRRNGKPVDPMRYLPKRR